ncbi:MAG: flagellar motor switch protein FliN [Phycisphaerales bacterium]|nr:flagellar motor switch protein FliN [Phycisphaerales bacterium]MDG1978761.1 flagellar motor switch protein FliN [Phycisphaerales bacterium]MDG2132543.1 flagellar motor switch protein FliN [Phycisphaerales bacterium]
MTEPPTDPTPQSPEPAPAEMVEEAIRDAGEQVDAMNDTAASAAGAVPLPDFGAGTSEAAAAGIGMLGDVDLDVRIELGRTSMLVDDVLKLSPDSVVELDKAAGDPVDIFVNGRHVARGEVLVLNENFCVRVSEIVGKIPETSSG